MLETLRIAFVKKFIRNFLSKKRNIVFLIILLLAVIVAVSYTLSGIQKNIEAMQEGGEAVNYFPEYPVLKKMKSAKADIVKRGEYLVKAGDCIACHTNTPARGKAFAGGLAMQTPFGVVYSPNITPDKETGIGKWTDEQFIEAMREGISPSGHHYYPAFPYLYFNKVSTDDLKAIKTYLDNIPPVRQANRENEMVWPFNWRFLQFGWRLLFFDMDKTGPFQPNPKQSPEWNRGAYLVEGLGHCAMCHTPSYYLFDPSLSLGAPIREYHLTGAKVQGYLAPNISKSNIGAIETGEIVKVFTHDVLIGGGSVEGPMLEANHDSLRYLTPEDLKAMATYLKSVNSAIPPKPTGEAPGKSVYDNYCSGCHATGGGGAPMFGDSGAWEPILKHNIADVYTNAIKGKGGMPAKGTCLSCTEQDIKDAVDYMVIAAKTGKPKAAPKVKKLTVEDGKRIYVANCSVCHSSGFQNAPKPGDKTAWKKTIDAGFITTFENVITGRQGHPPRGACVNCTDAEIKAAIKYMLQQSTTNKDFNLW